MSVAWPSLSNATTPKTLGVVDVVAKDGAAAIGSVGGGIFQTLGEARAVEDVVAQDHGAAVVANELLAQDKRLGQARRGWAGPCTADAGRTGCRHPAQPQSAGCQWGWR